jgi:hypothetical protein
VTTGKAGRLEIQSIARLSLCPETAVPPTSFQAAIHVREEPDNWAQ